MNDPISTAGFIRSHLKERYTTRTVVLGAHLGGELQAFFPQLNVKITFGGLRALISNFLQPFVREVGRSGADIVYEIDFTHPAEPPLSPESPRTSSVPRVEDSEPVRQSSSALKVPSGTDAQTPINLWVALTNPKLAIPVSWDASDNSFILGSAPSTDPGRPVLRAVSFEDHCKITQTYLEERGVRIAAAEADPADLQRYVPRVAAYLRQHGLLRDWEIYRTEAILQLLTHRLQQLGAQPAQVYALIARVRNAKPRSSGPPHAPAGATNMIATATASLNSTDHQLRDFFVKAIRVMPIDELRNLRIDGATIELALRLP